MNENIPAWRIVKFPAVKGRDEREWTYPSLEKANNARILARAWFNHEAALGKTVGWVEMAKAIGLPLRKRGKHSGMPFYTLVVHGRLPADDQIRDRLFKLAGYPWK